MIRRPPRSTLFPYTNALPISTSFSRCSAFKTVSALSSFLTSKARGARQENLIRNSDGLFLPPWVTLRRSEEHTSELQSRLHLVCRLLLEKKKTYKTQSAYTSY